MKLTIKQLRNVIRETIDEMKLGVANANPPGEAWGVKDDDEHTSTLKGLGDLIATVSQAFEPDEETLANQKFYRDYMHRMADYDFSDEGPDDEEYHVAGAYGDPTRVKTVKNVTERKSLRDLLKIK